MKHSTLLVFASLLLISFAQDAPSIVNSLGRFQLKNGGFKLSEKDTTATIEATSDALFLATLYGVQNKINTGDALQFIHSLENGDNGYGSAQGLASDLESTRYAIFSYHNLKATIPNSVSVGGYIQSLYQKDGLFASRANSKGDLRSTAQAVQALKALNIQDGAYIKSITSALHGVLKRLQKDGHFQDSTLSSITSTYYGLLIASLTGYEISNPEKWVSFIASYQAPEGGFYEENRKSVSLDATFHAVAALNIVTKGDFKSINLDNLLSYVKHSANDLRSSSLAHLVAALTHQALKASISYETDSRSGIADHTIVQGARVKPVVSVTSIVGTVHPNLTVQVSITAPNGVHSLKVPWNSDRQQYMAADSFDSSNQLGDVTFDYSIHGDIAELEGLSLSRSDVKHIGYGVTVAAQANFAGKDIKEGETIGVGTELRFGYTLHNQTNPAFYGGDFEMIFDILDSSLVNIYHQTLSGKDSRDAITFSYTLKSASVPSGQLTARLSLKGKTGVHTSKDVVYNLGVTMIATEINFDGFKANQAATYKLGDTAKISMVPASFPDLRTVYTYNTKDAASRTFFLDVVSSGGVTIQSIKGSVDSSSKDVLKYSFSVPIDPLIENIGNHLVSFRYVTAQHKDIPLNNYDSSLKELYEDTTLNFTVNAELHITNGQDRPTKGDFFYGNDIVFKFQVKDTLSNKLVFAGKSESANIFLELKHSQSGKTFVSSNQAASHYVDANGKPQGFIINWVINPNAVRGTGILTVVAHDADGNSLPLFEEKEKKPVSLNVNIGGDIDVSHHAYNFALDTVSTTFMVDFTLTCQDKPLKNALLRSVVSYKSEPTANFQEVFQLPVATNDAGTYETSWTVPHQRAPSGEYKLQFFREVDRLRAEDKTKKDTAEDIKPLFELTMSHTAAPTGQLPVRTEFVAILLLAAAFGAISLQKSKYLQ